MMKLNQRGSVPDEWTAACSLKRLNCSSLAFVRKSPVDRENVFSAVLGCASLENSKTACFCCTALFFADSTKEQTCNQ